jgi:acetylornithine deacetylase
MSDDADAVLRLAADLVAIDSRSFRLQPPGGRADRGRAAGFEVEPLDYVDANGVAKRALVAHRGPKGGYALSGHMDTVPETGWTRRSLGAARDAGGVLHGLGSVDMKGPVAACIVAARGCRRACPSRC